jgi:hypothetical protein
MYQVSAIGQEALSHRDRIVAVFGHMGIVSLEEPNGFSAEYVNSRNHLHVMQLLVF